jgi:hypothetical protein
VPAVRCRFLVDLVDGQEPGRSLIGRPDGVDQLVSDGAEGAMAFRHLR